MSEDWPYAEDGVKRDEFAESLRLPIISNPYPRWCYITAVMDDSDLDRSVRPTNDELRVVASFHEEYIEHWYRESYKAKLRERPFDLDGGANGRILLKTPEGGWRFRRCSWQYGPTFVPAWDKPGKPLVSILDQIHTLVDEVTPRWVQWKASHPDVFPVEVAS